MKQNHFFLLLLAFALLQNTLSAQTPKAWPASEIELELHKLECTGSVLYIAAHPDDENTRLISYLVNERKLRTGYLSLTRGDGGQNLIGSQQGKLLGAIRTQELLAARRTDGGEQYFTRAMDFGYSKTPEETFTKWNRDSILSDMVYVIRKFRPDVIITRFSTDGSGLHGHHTASALLAAEAFDAAADPNRFPEQLQFVQIWKPKRMYYNSTIRFSNPNADVSQLIKLDVGGYNQLLGKSYGEIAAESRSMHRSQGFGTSRVRGEQFEYFLPLKGDTSNRTDLFYNLDFTWQPYKSGKKIQSLIKEAILQLRNNNLNKLNLALLEILKLIPDNADEFNQYKRNQLKSILFHANGLFAEAFITGNAIVASGDSARINFQCINRGQTNISLAKVILTPFGEGSNCTHTNALSNPISLTRNKIETITFRFVVCPNTNPTQLFWLANEIKDNCFTIRQTDLNQGYHLTSGYKVQYTLVIQGKELDFSDQVVYKWADPDKGENYRPLVITPPVLINTESDAMVFADNKPREIRIHIKSGKENVQAVVHAKASEGWFIEAKGSGRYAMRNNPPPDEGFSVNFIKKGEERELVYTIYPSEHAGKGKIEFVVTVDKVSYNLGMEELVFDHIPVQVLFTKADLNVVKVELQRNFSRIAYIPGAGDEVPEALRNLGYVVDLIAPDQISAEKLQGYQAVITGVRAFNTNENLILKKPELLTYVQAGGNLILQYNTNSFAGPFKGDLGPYPFEISRDRITDETAKVQFLTPGHSVFNTPNKITVYDFEGWIQERSIYHASKISSQYITPLRMNDPGDKDNDGSLIIAPFGKGNFVYTGLVFFRELPAAVPGAYRLFVNLIELPQNK